MSKSRRWKGCCLMCALGKGKVRGLGKQHRMRAGEVRKAGGRKALKYGDLAD